MRNITEQENYSLEDVELYCVKSVIKKPKVSIIVPAYNTEKYIEKCILSLIKQTLRDIEIIIVNDGSTDNTLSIINKYAEIDARIKVISQENKKQGCARNNGTKLALGEFLGFIDSDDWVDLDYFEKLYSAAVRNNVDIALATNIRVGRRKEKKRLNIKDEMVYYSLQDKFDACCQYKNECPTNKLYRFEFLQKNNITWPEGCYCEDKLFTTQALYYSNGLVTVPNINYYYYRNPNSTVNSRERNHYKEIIMAKNEARKNVLDFLKSKNVDIRDKEFWAIKNVICFCGIPLVLVKESLNTEALYLFSLVKIGERRI